MTNLVARFLKDETGVNSIEYALIAGFLSIIIIAAVNGLGSQVKSNFTATRDALNGRPPASRTAAVRSFHSLSCTGPRLCGRGGSARTPFGRSRRLLPIS